MPNGPFSDGPTDATEKTDLLDGLTDDLIKNSRKNGTCPMDLSNSQADIFEKKKGAVLPGSQKSRLVLSSLVV
jgi:hypothetical protein